MTHKIYWAERGLRYLYEVVTAELFMYTFSMIFMRQDPRFVDAIWIAGIFLLSYLIRDLHRIIYYLPLDIWCLRDF